MVARLLEIEAKVLRRFGAATFTVKLDNDDPWVKRLVKRGLIERHPDDRCSYYRTKAGMEAWHAVQLDSH